MPKVLVEKYRHKIESAEAGIVRCAKYLMVQLKLMPHDYLKYYFDELALVYINHKNPKLCPNIYLLALERCCILADAFCGFLNEAIETATYLEARYYREMQIAVLKKLELLFQSFHKKIQDFFSKYKIVSDDGMDFKKITEDFLYFVSLYYPGLYAKLAGKIADHLDLCFDQGEPLAACFVGESLEKYHVLEKEIENLIQKQHEILKYLEPSIEQVVKLELKETIQDWEAIKQDVSKKMGLTERHQEAEIDAPLRRTRTTGVLCDEYQNFKKAFEDLKLQIEEFLTAECRRKSMDLEKGNKLMADIGKFLKMITSFEDITENTPKTIFHGELKYAKEVALGLQRELTVKCPELTATASEKAKTETVQLSHLTAAPSKKRVTSRRNEKGDEDRNEDEALLEAKPRKKKQKRNPSGPIKSSSKTKVTRRSRGIVASSKKPKKPPIKTTGSVVQAIDLTEDSEVQSLLLPLATPASIPGVHPQMLLTRETIDLIEPNPLLYQYAQQALPPLSQYPSSLLPALPSSTVSQTSSNIFLPTQPLPKPIPSRASDSIFLDLSEPALTYSSPQPTLLFSNPFQFSNLSDQSTTLNDLMNLLSGTTYTPPDMR